MRDGRVLIVTDTMDAHADWVAALLRRRGQDPLRLNFGDIPLKTSFACSLAGDRWRGRIGTSRAGRDIPVAEIAAVWWRKPYAFRFPDDIGDQEREFAIDEITHTVLGLLSAADPHWVSHPDDIRRASYKIDQLRRAARLGFDVPRTLVTSEPDAAKDFYDLCSGRVVYKVLTDPYLGIRRLAMKGSRAEVEVKFVETTLVTPAEVGMFDRIRLVPCQFQEYMEKAKEFRVTVIAGEPFVAEIGSAGDGQVDWRQPGTRYALGTLPADVVEKCVRLTASYRLEFGAIDLALTPDGRYVFFEINPNGQFLFLQEQVPELRLAEAMVHCLTREGGADDGR